MAAGSTVTAMKTAVQARRRYLIGVRLLASSKPRMNRRDEMAQLKDFVEKLDFKTFETKFYETTVSGAKAGKNLAAASVSPLRRIYDFLEIKSMALPHEWIWRCNLAGIFFASLVAGNVAADEWGKRTNTKQKLLLDEAGKQEAAREGFLKS